MPIYEYLCTAGHRVDVVQKFADDALTKCEVCGKSAQRVLHAPSIHFKGKGFYATDYGKRKGTNGDKADSSSSDSGSKEAAASSSSDGDSGSKSESKGSDSKSSESKSSDSKSSGGESSSSKKSGSKPAA